jgi:hypothetical protein
MVHMCKESGKSTDIAEDMTTGMINKWPMSV